MGRITEAKEEPAGRSPEDFAKVAGIGRTTLYTLAPEDRPASVKIGRRTVITESPRDWLARMAARTQAAA